MIWVCYLIGDTTVVLLAGYTPAILYSFAGDFTMELGGEYDGDGTVGC